MNRSVDGKNEMLREQKISVKKKKSHHHYMNNKKATQNKNSKERCASATIITTTKSPKIKLESAYFIAIFV